MFAMTGGTTGPQRRTPAPPLRNTAESSTRRLFSLPQSRIAGTDGSVLVMFRCLSVTSLVPHFPSTITISGAPVAIALPSIVVAPAALVVSSVCRPVLLLNCSVPVGM